MGIWADELSKLKKGDAIPDDIDAYGYLQGVYQGRWPYEPHRVRAARECLPFERPKLAVTAIVDDDGSFAARLELAIARSQRTRTIEAPANSEPLEGQTEGGPKVEPTKINGMVPDRRYRR